MASDPVSLTTGQTLGRYELLAAVARGGMGQVWAGRLRGARGFHKLVAVKTLLPAGSDDDRMERMLLEEARIASLIQHSNVVQTLELGEHEGTLYLVMEWVDGEPLSYVIKCAEASGGVPLPIAVNLVAQTLRGLQAAHELSDETGTLLGVVHRDVSPHNVLVSYGGVAKLLDFGIAKAMNRISDSTEAGEIKGKFAYMAPEQILNREVDHRADLFAAGIMLYLLTTGKHPFKNHDSAGVLHSITSEEPATRPSLVRSGYSRTLEAVVMRALEKDRDARWSSAEEMRLALQRAVPQAFGLGFESQLRTFMTDMVGERAARKREALRRAELAADAQIKDGVAPALSSAQSASSLRAISIDRQEPEAVQVVSEVSQSPAFQSFREAPRVPPPARRRWLVPAAALGFASVVALAMLIFGKSEGTNHSASAPSSGMAELPRASAHPLPRASAVPAQPAVSVTPTAEPISLDGQAGSGTGVAHSSPPTPGAHKTPPSKLPVKLPVTKHDDLIAPDYAR